jgi:DNA-binding XRE family transcriptional regulator
MKYDLLHIQGKPYVLVPLHDYRALTGEDGKNDLPEDVLNRLAAEQDSPIKIIRKYRGMTQVDLAEAAGISRPYLAEIETGKKGGSLSAYKRLAEALNVRMDALIKAD